LRDHGRDGGMRGDDEDCQSDDYERRGAMKRNRQGKKRCSHNICIYNYEATDVQGLFSAAL
jgi:hypothetical protein